MSALRPKFGLLLKPSVEKELEISPAQHDKIRAALSPILVNNGTAMRIGMDTDLAKIDWEALATLSASQKSRLMQVWLQRQETLALADPTVARQLALTQAQKREVEKIYDDFEDKLQAAARNATHEGGMIRMDDSGARKETIAQLWKVLTPQQSAQFKKMQGPKFQGEL